MTLIEQQKIQAQEDLQLLLAILPNSVRQAIAQEGREHELLEVVMDLGRTVSARYVDGEIVIRESEVTQEEIDQVVNGMGDLDDDNRAGIARTLHRISGIRNRKGNVIGLTCRVGRAVFGTVDIIEDIVEHGYSILLLGRPGVGKTTMLREMARILADKKRVVIVDTSNEIGGDGDIPHPAVGRARRMQVPRPSHQHETMIEAVENHNPQVIVIDEIGREQEAAAARTINERGVQLIGTAHGNSLENLMLNPTLSDLIGGIESVTLSDDEARRRGTQKTVLERRSPPTFDVLIEIQDREKLLIHPDVTSSVDQMLRGFPLHLQFRYRDDEGNVHIEEQDTVLSSTAVTGRRDQPARTASGRDGNGRSNGTGNGRANGPTGRNGVNGSHAKPVSMSLSAQNVSGDPDKKIINVLAFGVARNRLIQAAKRLNIYINVVKQLDEADVFVTLKSYYRKRRQMIRDAERYGVPVFVLRANTSNQMENFLSQVANLGQEIPADPFKAAIADAEEGIRLIQSGHQSVDLRPVGSAMRRYQHKLARESDLVSHSYGKEPSRYVRIFNTVRNSPPQ